MHVSSEAVEKKRAEFDTYLKRISRRAGYHTDAELAAAIREAGNARFNPSVFSKWRIGATDPSIDSLRWIARVCNEPPINLYLRAGVLLPSDLERPDSHPLYEDLAALDRALEMSEIDALRGEELTYLRRHVTMLLSEVGRRLEELTGTKVKPRRRRKAS
jgi:transcriptional regulator with XRE-family HTH domain